MFIPIINYLLTITEIFMSLIKNTALAACALLSVATVAMADEGFYFSPEVGYVLPTEGEVDDTTFVGARLGYDIDSNFALELESGWMETAYDISGGTQNVDIDSVPVLFNVRYNFDRCAEDDIGFYTFAGVGAVFNDLETNDLGADLDNTVALQAGAGMDVPVADNVSAFLDVRYLWNQPDISGNSAALTAAGADSDVDLSAVMFVAGVKL